MTKVFILAVENSADHLGAQLALELRAQDKAVKIMGVGGETMRAAGVPSQMDITGLAILGFTEGLRSYPHILRKVKEAVARIMDSGADTAVLIDSWGFMVRVAQRLKKLGYKGQIIKYLAPQVWAMREGRAKILARHVDHLLTIHSFDAPYFERHGLAVHYVGNPIFDVDYNSGDKQALRDEYNLGDKDIIAVFFGSRPSEIARLATPFADTITQLRQSHPDIVFLSAVSNSVAKDVAAAAGADLRLQNVILLPERRKLDVMACANAALACSGTMTSQLAAAGVPSVVAYKLAPLTYMAAKRLYKPDYISIVNIAAGRALMPEFLQRDVNGPQLSAALAYYLDNPRKQKSASKALLDQTTTMRGASKTSASAQAAQAVLDIIA
ncbi:MAG: lipid-A-disaccharide synthase [Litorimonas sp.]